MQTYMRKNVHLEDSIDIINHQIEQNEKSMIFASTEHDKSKSVKFKFSKVPVSLSTVYADEIKKQSELISESRQAYLQRQENV